jgi:hypothetical protein
MEEQMNASRLILMAINETEKSENVLQWALHKLFTSQDRIVLVYAQRDRIVLVNSTRMDQRTSCSVWYNGVDTYRPNDKMLCMVWWRWAYSMDYNSTRIH